MFNYRLSRLPYFVLILIYNFWTIGMLDAGSPGGILWVLVSIPVSLILIVLPRVRDCDWPQWVGFLTIIPYLGSVTGIALLFARSKVIGRGDDPDRMGAELPTEPQTVAVSEEGMEDPPRK